MYVFLKKLSKLFRILKNCRYYFSLERENSSLQLEKEFLAHIIKKMKIDKYKLREKKDNIKVIFLVQEPSLFPVFSSVFNEISKSKIFTPIIVLTPKYFCGAWEMGAYSELATYFSEKKIPYIDGVKFLKSDGQIGEVIDLQDLNPHFVFYTCPYMGDYNEMHRCQHVNNFSHVCYIPYGFLLAHQPETQYNQEIHNIAWKIYCETEYHHSNYDINSKKGSNVLVTGYTKFDLISNLSDLSWAKKIKQKHKKSVMIAPHWSIGTISEITRFGTFDKYYSFIFELPKKFPDIYFIFKPHPSLRNALDRGGGIKNVEYDAMIDSWRDNHNAIYYDGADYFKYFSLSDGLITDSVSFLAEYLLTEKPMLLLGRQDHSAYNKVGEMIFKAIERASNQNDIMLFLNDVIISGNDSAKEGRISLKKVIKPTEGSACEKIRKDLESILEN